MSGPKHIVKNLKSYGAGRSEEDIKDCEHMMIDVITCIKELIEEKHMSMYQLAQKADISQSTLSNIIRRQNAPALNTLDKICSGMGMTLLEFFTYMELRYTDSPALDARRIMEMYLRLSPDSRKYIMTSLQYALDMERGQGNRT